MSEPTPKHMPGPWAFGEKFNGDEREVAAQCGVIGVVWPWCDHDNEADDGSTIRDANARLIAAAPDMLDELKRLAGLPQCAYCGWLKAEVYGHHSGCRLAAVIAKATGATQ
jgi:hypothetical protein